MITLRQLQIFAEVVRAGGFRRCGERMGMSQVSVSEHVRALEARWHTTLFERRPGAVSVLTEAGRAAYERASVILADVADLDRELTVGQRGDRRRIPIALHAYMMRDLHPVIGTLEKTHSVTISIDLSLCWPGTLVERVAKRELDAAYFFALTEADVPEAGLIGMEELAIYVGPGHRFAGRTNVTLAELAGEPSAQLTRRDPLAALISRAFAACGVTDRAIGIETDDFGLIVSFVLRNQGYACLFASTADEPGSATGLVRVPLRPPLPPLQVRLLSRRSAEHDPVLSAFMDAVAERWRGS